MERRDEHRRCGNSTRGFANEHFSFATLSEHKAKLYEAHLPESCWRVAFCTCVFMGFNYHIWGVRSLLFDKLDIYSHIYVYLLGARTLLGALGIAGRSKDATMFMSTRVTCLVK